MSDDIEKPLNEKLSIITGRKIVGRDGRKNPYDTWSFSSVADGKPPRKKRQKKKKTPPAAGA